MRDISRHTRRLTQQGMHRHINGVVVEEAITHDQLSIRGCCPHDGKGTALAFA